MGVDHQADFGGEGEEGWFGGRDGVVDGDDRVVAGVGEVVVVGLLGIRGVVLLAVFGGFGWNVLLLCCVGLLVQYVLPVLE